MRSEDPGSLRFALTRSVTLFNIVELRDFLRDSGNTVSLLKRAQSGVDFSFQQSGGKDIRWPCRRFENIEVAIGVADEFVKPLSTIDCEYEQGMPLWHPENSIEVRMKELGGKSFSEKEKRDFCSGMVNCLGVINNEIYNRSDHRFKILESDEKIKVNLFLEYDAEKEIRTWTIQCPDYADCDDERERLFKCWRCGLYKKEGEFHYEQIENTRNRFYAVLETYVNSHVTCCTSCVWELTMCKAPVPYDDHPPLKRRKY
jgi:hypothetical protein